MKLTPTPFDIPEGNPFLNDALGHRKFIEALSTLVADVNPPFVFCIDAPWGMGKTTFLKLWKAHLSGTATQVLYFNAWTSDFATDPLVAFVSEIASLAEALDPNTSKAKRIKQVKKIGAQIARRGIPVAAKIVTLGVINAEELIEDAASELLKGLAEDAIKAYESEKKLIAEFHSVLTKLVSDLPAVGGRPARLLVLVDELDRCRPPYALELLERVKHLFNVQNVVFALALDKRQLRASVASMYGPQINGEEYLRRFFDVEFSLPRPKDKKFTDGLLKQFDFEEVFSRRKHPVLQHDVNHIRSAFNGLADLFQLTLRAREQCFARLRATLLSIPDDHFIYPDALISMIVLRMAARDVYDQFVSGTGSVSDVVAHLRTLDGGAAFLDSHPGTVFEAMLIAARFSMSGEPTEYGEHLKLANEDPTPGASKDLQRKRERAGTIVAIIRQTKFQDGQSPNLPAIAARIELLRYDDN